MVGLNVGLGLGLGFGQDSVAWTNFGTLALDLRSHPLTLATRCNQVLKDRMQAKSEARRQLSYTGLLSERINRFERQVSDLLPSVKY